MKNLKCSNCGSTSFDISNDKAICKHCGTLIILEKEKNNQKLEIKLNVENSPNYGKNFWEIKAEKSSNEFLRESFIGLAVDTDIPKDIFQSTFDKVVTEYKSYANIGIYMIISYSVSIGYDKTEKHKSTVRTFDPKTNKYRNEVDYRYEVVTDYKPYQGSKEFTYSEALCLDSCQVEGAQTSPDQISNWISKQEKCDYDSSKINNLNASEEQINSVAVNCYKFSKEKIKSSLPGDRYKDFSSTNKYKDNVEFYIVPQYNLNYIYKNFNYKIQSIGGNSELTIKKSPNTKKEIVSEINKKTNILAILTYISFPISILLSLIYLLPSSVLSFIYDKNLSFLCFVFILICAVACLFGGLLLKERKYIFNNIIYNQQSQKINDLKKVLNKNNLKELQDIEVEKILNFENKNENIPGKKLIQTLMAFSISFSIFCLIKYLIFFT